MGVGNGDGEKWMALSYVAGETIGGTDGSGVRGEGKGGI